MKTLFKRAVLLIFAVIFIFTLVLTLDITLNLKIRKKIFETTHRFEMVNPPSQTVFLDEDYLEETNYNDQINQWRLESNRHYFNTRWLKSSNTTALYDEKTDAVYLEAPWFSLKLEADGKALLNSKPINQKIDFKRVDKEVFIPYEAMEAIPEFSKLGFKMITGNNTVFFSDYLNYNEYQISEEQALFASREKVQAYRELKTQYIPFINKIGFFDKIQVTGKAENENMIIYKKEGVYDYAVTSRGEIGYISPVKEEMIKRRNAALTYEYPKYYNEPIVLTWEAVYSVQPDTTSIAPMIGMNVLSPTWYDLADESGNVKSKPSMKYLEWANQNGYKIWALVTNDFDIDRTHAFLYDRQAREKFISYMLAEAKKYNYEGINIDFEHIYMNDKDALSHFVNEFSKASKSEGLILSMDVTVMGGSDNWSKCYDHELLGRLVDYLVVMTYDQYWASSPISGPVAAYDWVEASLDRLLQVVPNDKLIMGIPLYTRVWRESPSKETPNQVKTKSSAIGMTAQNNLIEKNKLNLVWDDTQRLYFTSFYEEGTLVKIWVENAQTLSEKVSLAKEKNLAGVAAWRRGFETQDIWPAINSALRE